MNNKVSSVLNSIEKIDNLIMEADVSVSDAMSDVYSKQFKMEGNVTEDYINHEYYQESVIAGILIGGGIIAVLATAIVLITKHVKKSASGDPEKKNDTSTAAGVSLDKPEEFNKKVEQLKSELEKAGGKLTISDVGFDASKLKQKYEMIKELCGYAETFLKGTEDDEIDGALNEFNKKLEEINGIDYKLSGEVEVTPASLDEIKSLAAPIQQMTANLEKVSKEFEKRSKENKNANTGEMDDAKKERFEKLKEGLNQINKGSTDLGKSVDNEFSIIRKYFEAVSKAAKEKDKPAQAESEKQSSKQSSSKTPDEILNTVIQTHPAYKSYENDAEILGYISKLLVDSPHMVENPESPKAKTLLMTFKNKKPIDDNNELIEMSLTRDVTKELLREIGWPEDKINEIRFSDENEERIKNVLSNYKPGESEHKSEETGSPKTDENSQEIDLSQEDMKNIAEFANTFILQGKNKKGTATMPKDEVKNILSEITRSIKSSQYDDINDKIFELFNKQDNIDLKSIFVDLMLTAKNPIFKGKAPSESLLSDMEKIASGKTIETEELKYKPNPKMDSVDASGKKSPDPANGNPTLKDNNLMDSLSTITKSPAEILDTVIQNNPNYKKYENDQYVINTIIPTFSKMRYEELVQTVQSVKPDADIIQASLFRDIAKEIAKEQGWTDKIDNIKLSDENEKRVNEYLRANKVQLTDDTMNNIAAAIYEKRRTEGKQLINNETDFIKNIINTMKNQGINPALSRYYSQLRTNIQDDASLTDSAKHMAELMHDTAVYYGNLIGDTKKSIMPIPADLTMASQTKSDEPELEKKSSSKTPDEILNTVIQTHPAYKSYENDAEILGYISKLLVDSPHMVENPESPKAKTLLMTFKNKKPIDDNNELIEMSLTRDVTKELLREIGWPEDKINEIRFSDENEERIKNVLSSAKSLPTVSDVLDDVNKAVEQFNKAIDPMKTSEINETDKTFQSFKDDLNYIKTNGLEDVFNAIINANNINLNDQISQSTYLLLVILKDITIRCYEHESELNILLSSLYANGDQTLNPISFEAVKTYAEMRGISVTLTKPDGTQVEVGTKSDVKSASDTTADTKPKTLRWFIENPEVSIDYVNKNLFHKDKSHILPIIDFVKELMIKVRDDNNLINVLEKYGTDTGKYNLDDELTWDNAEYLSHTVTDLMYMHKYGRNDINKYLKNEYSDGIMIESMKDKAFYLAKAYVELYGGPNELLKPDGTMVSVTPAKTSTQSADNTQPKNTNQDGNNTPPTQTEMAKLKNHTLVHDVVTEANQRDEDGVPMITNDMETELKNASEEHLMDFIGHFITELTGNHTMIETIPFTRRNIITLAAYAKQANKLLKSQNNLRDFLTQQYGYYKDPAQQEYIYKMAKLFAQDYNISVVLTDPSGKKEYINPTTTFN